jgi:prolyl oligopeptidase
MTAQLRITLVGVALSGISACVATVAPDKGAVTAASTAAAPPMNYPKTHADDTKDVLHGVTVPDPYRWLEDGKSPEVQAWMTAQDEYARQRLAKLPGRDALAARLKQLLYLDSIGSPQRHGQRTFYTRRHASKEKSVVYWREGSAATPSKTNDNAGEHVLFDPNTWSKDGSESLGEWEVSEDGKTVAYTVHHNNSDEATLYVMDVASGKKSDIDVIEGAKYASPSWTPKGDGFYYSWLPTDPKIPEADRPGYMELRYHALGTKPADDVIVAERLNDPTSFQYASVSRDGHWLIRGVGHGWYKEDVFFRDLRDPKQKKTWQTLVSGRDAMFGVSVWRDRFYVRTNDGAPRWQLLRVDPAHPERAHWKTLVAEPAEGTLDGFNIVGERLVVTYLKDVVSEVEIRELDGTVVRALPLPGLGSVGGPSGNEDEDEAYFSFTSFTHPTEIYALSMKSGATKLWFRLDAPVDPKPYLVEQVFFKSKDGTRIPMFIVRRKDLVRDGSTPALLTGYGGFQISETPYFSASRFAWLEQGGLVAVPALRGGGEYGEAWHEAGMLHNKQNVFDDFIAAAEYLVKEGYTRPEHLAIAGGSNGGLLVGGAMTQRPDLFKVVLCGVPLLDMVRYQRFGSGKTWVSEYGSADKPDDFRALYAYSPYHHIKPGTRYPSVLMLSADSDDRVDPMHARKFTAALQAASTGGPIWLRIERNAGHGGADLIKATVEQLADQYAFALAELRGANALSAR